MRMLVLGEILIAALLLAFKDLKLETNIPLFGKETT